MTGRKTPHGELTPKKLSEESMTTKRTSWLLEIVNERERQEEVERGSSKDAQAREWISTRVMKLSKELAETPYGTSIVILDLKEQKLSGLEHKQIAVFDKELGIDVMSKAKIANQGHGVNDASWAVMIELDSLIALLKAT